MGIREVLPDVPDLPNFQTKTRLKGNILLQSYARYSSNNLESSVESFLKKLQYVLVNGLTIKSELHARTYKSTEVF